ncbi:MAG: response regulator [Phaeodactylibacter sp.]|nr:response regulator [Phaeodactylibacter sp.]MCB9053508.1 response regulator [Lewinellaceae bacterium]
MRHPQHSAYLSLFLALLPLFLYGQNKAANFRFEKLPAEIGFSNTGVNDILEDHQGFLWMATWSGLAKYDGYSVKMYRQQPGNTNGLKSNKVTQLFEDNEGNLWAGTNYTGFYRYNRALDVFEQYCRDPEDMNSLSNDNVWAIFQDREGVLWIGTERGLNRFQPEAGRFVHYRNDPADSRSLSHDFVYTIAQTPDGSLWVGTEEGLNRLVRNGAEEYFIRYNLAPAGVSDDGFLPHNFVYKILPSRYDPFVFWVCTSIGLKKVRFSPDDPAWLDVRFYGHDAGMPNSLSHPFVPDVLEEDAGHVWVATYNGLNLLDTESGESRHFTYQKNDPASLSNNVVLCLSKDRTGNLWIGMDKGVNKLNLNAKAFLSIRPDAGGNTCNNITCLAPASGQAGLWAGSRGGGLIFLPTDGKGSLSNPARNFQMGAPQMPQLAGFISGLLLDREGWLWMATDGAGVFRARETDILGQSRVLRQFQQFTKSNKLSDDYVMSLLQSASGDVWLGYWDKGLDRYDPATGIFHHYLSTVGLSVNFQEFPVVHLGETVEGGQPYLWLGTRGGGVYKLKFDDERNVLELVQRFRSEVKGEGSLSNNFINCFLIDKQGRLWVGTDSGLNLLDSKAGRFSSYYERNGLANAIVQSILEDEEGNIWISTQQGISCLSFTADTLTVKNFDAYDGLQDNFFNDDAAATTAVGHLVFGGVNGLSIFRPEEIRPDTIPPKIAITDFRLFNRSVPIGKLKDGRTVLTKSISETEFLQLNYRDQVVSFEFTGLHFGEPKKLHYAYQLEGFDPDWVYTEASQRIAHYTNLPYGDFIFKVKAANGDGLWSEPVELQLCVSPPFWFTGWAYTLYALAALALFYFGLRITQLRAEFRHSLELERVEREKLEEVNQLKLQFFTNISHELRTPLTLIISPLEQLLQDPIDRKMHRLFTRMHFNANRLLTMINQLLDIRKSEAGVLKLHVAEGGLVEFSREVVASFKNLAKQRNIQLSFFAEQEEIFAWFDHDQLEKVLFNLLSNAFKFTNDGGQITVSLRQPGPAEITVADTGVGIPAGQLESIFERFYQVEKSKEWARKGGTGIGLSLAKMIVEKHHGKIEVESEEGKGSAFRIRLPLDKSLFTEEELRPLEQVANGLPAFALPDSPEKLPPPSSQNGVPFLKDSGEKPLILLVEDNPDIRGYLRENLEADYRISEASDGQEGLEKALAEPPELIIADIAMPRMDGIEMCGKVKSNITTSHIPVILLTARTSLVFKVDGLETGADDYVTKPFHMRLLAARIRNLINTRRALRERFAKNFDLSPSSLPLNSLDEKLLSQIKTVVERHIDDSNFSVDQLATALNMSRMQLYRKLKALTGKSPNRIIRSFRLKRAAQLLESGQYNVSDVTYMVGYNDLKSFRDQFKKEFGVCPSGYEGGGPGEAGGNL